ncbi:lantibiotic immunity ABC transporter MutE/EpiE family permease subunit [Clostridioides sp. ZZV15-6388]|uniref:lantibiotic immunity ABC transporter MutE/EpiE family permease subunit n=1 Tax=unclassified Clostridioides TaxID=2635829 RepID=UPI001D0FBF51|nr:lantibiotic immunity ABC transporter MutE/EpiE family permease subunit [Clostridioides sp. ZZV15-6388]MCC0665802.1 lantibiotic immunity ABC transporter MutE/EpiE family permease subunit [Clostridioides sp. ZZV15-6597]
MNGLKSELLKYKRTFMGKLIVFIPIFFALYSGITQSTIMKNPLSQSSSWSWDTLLALVFNTWPLVFLPLGMGLFATLVAGQERKAGNYRTLRAYNVSPMALWINKVMAMAVYTLLSTLVLIVATIISGLFLSEGAIPFGKIIAGGFVCWFVSLTLIPIQLWVATWKGTFSSMGIALVGMMVSVLTAIKSLWFAVPWSWAMRLMCPIVGVHPNGAILETGNPLLDSSVIPVGIIVSMVVFVVITVITGIWFNRREVK